MEEIEKCLQGAIKEAAAATKEFSELKNSVAQGTTDFKKKGGDEKKKDSREDDAEAKMGAENMQVDEEAQQELNKDQEYIELKKRMQEKESQFIAAKKQKLQSEAEAAQRQAQGAAELLAQGGGSADKGQENG